MVRIGVIGAGFMAETHVEAYGDIDDAAVSSGVTQHRRPVRHGAEHRRRNVRGRRRHADLGIGSVDLRGCVNAAIDVGAEWLLFEHGLSDEPVESAEAARPVLDDLLPE